MYPNIHTPVHVPRYPHTCTYYVDGQSMVWIREASIPPERPSLPPLPRRPLLQSAVGRTDVSQEGSPRGETTTANNKVRTLATTTTCVRMYVHVYVCMCVHVYVCTYVRVYICACVRVYVCTCVRVYVCTCVGVYICTCVCVYVHMCMCMCVHVYMCTYVHVYVRMCM